MILDSKSLALFLVFPIILFSGPTDLKDEKTECKIIVESFFRDVFASEKSLKLISEEYRFPHKENKDGNKFALHIQSLRKQKEQFYRDIDKIVVESYEESSIRNRWLFDKKKWKNIYVVSGKGNLQSYVLMKKCKIVACINFRKGSDDEASFIPYWLLPKD